MKNKLFIIVSNEEEYFEDDLEYYVNKGYVPIYETFRRTEYENEYEITGWYHILLKYESGSK